MKPSSTSVSIPLPSSVVTRFEREGSRLVLPTSMVLGCAVEEVARVVKEGWRPKTLPPTGQVFIFLRMTRARKRELDELAETAGINFVDIARIATWGALLQMEANDQILWPLNFSKRELLNAVAAADVA